MLYKFWSFSACDLPNNPIYIRCNGTETNKDYRQKFNSRLKNPVNPWTYGPTKSLWNFDESDVSVQRTHRGIYLSPADPIQVRIGLIGNNGQMPQSTIAWLFSFEFRSFIHSSILSEHLYSTSTQKFCHICAVMDCCLTLSFHMFFSVVDLISLRRNTVSLQSYNHYSNNTEFAFINV